MTAILESLLARPGSKYRALAAIESTLGRRLIEGLGLSPARAREIFEGRIAAAAATDKRAIVESIGEVDPAAPPPASERLVAEAIVRLAQRPVYLIRNDKVDLASGLDTFDRPLVAPAALIEPLIPRVGRVEILNGLTDWLGTAWLIEDDLVVTNRHVAEEFAEADGRGRFRFRLAGPNILYAATIDFLEEHENAAERIFEVKRIEYVAPSDGPDIALLRLSKPAGEGLALQKAAVARGDLVGIVGYPANDPNSTASSIERYFGAIFDKKRFAPGFVMQPPDAGNPHLTHDCSTLGGNSGSPVLNLTSGEAVGLHFAGSFRSANFAVPADLVVASSRGLRTFVEGIKMPRGIEEAKDGRHAPAHFNDRNGYQAHHLSEPVPLPGFDLHVDAIASSGSGQAVAAYQNFSVVLHAGRRVPLFTAVNIDGEQSIRIKRGRDKWFVDERYDAAAQLTQAHYSHPDIDRGHMVRREDPNWGEEAETANLDTFHYVNAAPQHADLNQGKRAWLGLETYILDSARTHGFRASVFTGPVLRETDRWLDTDGGPIQIPEEFWKVVVATDAATGRLRATAYLLGQGQVLDRLEETSFRYGRYGTFQVSVASIEAATRLDFGALKAADPLGRPESAGGGRFRRFLAEPEEMLL